MKAISLTSSNALPVIDLDLENPSITAGLLRWDIAHAANLVSKQGMYYDRAGEHHLVVQFRYLKTFDEGSATATLLDEFIEQE